MPLADITSIDVLWICLSIFLIIVGISLAVMLLRFAGSAQRLTSLLGGVEDKALPVIEEVNGTVERMNVQLDKADVVTTSAVDAVSAVDRSVRAVAGAVSWPVRKLSSLTTGVRYGSASLRTEQDVTRAYEAGRAAAKRRAADLSEELDETGPAAGSAARKDTSSGTVWTPPPGRQGSAEVAAEPPSTPGPSPSQGDPGPADSEP